MSRPEHEIEVDDLVTFLWEDADPEAGPRPPENVEAVVIEIEREVGSEDVLICRELDGRGFLRVGDEYRVRRSQATFEHRCMDLAVAYESDGPLGHGFECGRCGRFLQAG